MGAQEGKEKALAEEAGASRGGGPGHWGRLFLDGLAVVILLSLLFIVGLSGGDPKNSKTPAPQAADRNQRENGAAKPGSIPRPAAASAPEFGTGQEPLEQILSRPVARDAIEPNEITAPAGGKKEYRIRFAVCQLEESCLEVKERLKGKGIAVSVIQDDQSITVYHAAVGPWPTAAHASEAARKLAEAGLACSVLSSADKFYLITAPRFFLSAAESDLSAVQSSGYQGKIFSRKETQRMYKAYGDSFNDHKAAKLRLDFYKGKKVDCLLEEK